MAPPSDAAPAAHHLRADRRLESLDVIRGAATLVVLAVHGPEIPNGAWGHSLDVVWKRCGWASVDLFFALSGFLIVALLLGEHERTGRVDAKAFFVRRAFKIYPPYVVLLLALVGWEYARTQGALLQRLAGVAVDLWPAFAHVQNYVPVRSAPHLWSLSMEEHCYAMLLVLAVVHAARSTGGRPSRVIPIAVGVLLAASWLARWAHVTWSYGGIGPIGFTYTHHRIDALLAGTLAAWIVRHRRGATLGWRGRTLLILATVVCFVPTFSLEVSDEHRPFILLAALPLQAVGFGCLLVAVAASSSLAGAVPADETSTRPAWPARVLVFVGVTSYSTYLWHMPFAASLFRVLFVPGLYGWRPAGPALCLVAFVLVSLAMGVLLFWLVEKPAQAWRRRFFAVRDRRSHARQRAAEVA